MKHFVIIVLLLFLLAACNKDTHQGQQVVPDNSATLHIEVRHFFMDSSGNIADTPLHQLPIYLYQNYADADNSDNLLQSKLTDINGKTTFYKLDSLQYAIRAEHPLLGIKIQSVNTPHKSVVNQVIVF